MAQEKGKAAKMKAEPARRRLTRMQRKWLKLQEFVPQNYQEVLLETSLPFMVHARRLGFRVSCVPGDGRFIVRLRYTGPSDANDAARIKLLSSLGQSDIPFFVRLL